MNADLDLAGLEALLEAATPGPWEAKCLMATAGRETLFHAGTTNSFRPPRPHETEANVALIVAAVNALPLLLSRHKEMREALEQVRDLEPEPFDFPADWSEQRKACPDCERWKDHPIQRGICDTHRKPLWAREEHDKREEARLGYRAKVIARAALTKDAPHVR